MYSWIWTEKRKRLIIEKLAEYFRKYGNGESINQNDRAQIEAIQLLSDIADDILKVKYYEDS